MNVEVDLMDGGWIFSVKVGAKFFLTNPFIKRYRFELEVAVVCDVDFVLYNFCSRQCVF